MRAFLFFNFFSTALPLAAVAGLAGAACYISGLPLRRHEHARFLLDTIESALSQGQPVESYIISLARTRDRSISVRFQLLAAHLELGNSLIAALERVPRLLPSQVLAMLKVGESLGDFRRVLPACRELLQDGISQSRALINYEVAFAFILNPAIIFLPLYISAKVTPVFKGFYSSMGLHPTEDMTRFVRWAPLLVGVQMLVVLAIYLFAVLFLGGPRFVSWVEERLVPAGDWLYLKSPWRKKRLQRDFSAMLALLLDAGLAEERAVTLAASSTANSVFMRIARQVVEQLGSGVKLPAALEMIDTTGEFRWRVQIGARGARGFFRALKGWHESLSATAFQQEQAAAQTITTALVLLNAASVALAAFGVLQAIANLTPLK
jgi:type II secretory pathway component PulF